MNQDILYKMRVRVTAQATNLHYKLTKGPMKHQSQKRKKRKKKRIQKNLIQSVSVKRVRNNINKLKRLKNSLINKCKSNLRVQMNTQLQPEDPKEVDHRVAALVAENQIGVNRQQCHKDKSKKKLKL